MWGDLGWDTCLDASSNAVPAAWVLPMHFLREPRQLWALLVVALLGAGTMDCRCTEPHIPFGALLPALAALLPLSLVYASWRTFYQLSLGGSRGSTEGRRCC